MCLFVILFRDIYAINGVSGKVLDGWPIKVGHPINSNILVTKVSSMTKTLDMVSKLLICSK